MVSHNTNTYSRQERADITENSGKTVGRSRRLFRSLIGRSDTDKSLRTINEETGHCERKYRDYHRESGEKYDIVVMVGDRRFDVEGAKAFHIASVGVNYGYAAPGELSLAGADVTVETVEALGETLK